MFLMHSLSCVPTTIHHREFPHPDLVTHPCAWTIKPLMCMPCASLGLPNLVPNSLCICSQYMFFVMHSDNNPPCAQHWYFLYVFNTYSLSCVPTFWPCDSSMRVGNQTVHVYALRQPRSDQPSALFLCAPNAYSLSCIPTIQHHVQNLGTPSVKHV